MNIPTNMYIAGLGMISAVGANTSMTVAAVNAGVSGYAKSRYCGLRDEAVTMANIPNNALAEIEAEIDEGDVFCERHYRVTLMAIAAIREACALQTSEQAIPLLLAMSDVQEDTDGLNPMVVDIETNCQPWVRADQSRSIHSGRAAGIDAIDFAFRYLGDNSKFILVGGSDSYQDYDRITPLADANRLLCEGNMDGFAPGEAASFILLTSDPKLAMVRNANIIGLKPPGIAEDSGHIHSKEAYRGEGLDQAFKKALLQQEQRSIHTIYSCMNGENHWAKEYGVAFCRNKDAFLESVKTKHPADILGDVGAATSSMLIALAAEDLYETTHANAYMVYSSSDTAKRGAIVLEKFAVANMI